MHATRACFTYTRGVADGGHDSTRRAGSTGSAWNEKGHGLFATRAIAAQEVVTEFQGDLIGAAEAQQRVAHYSDAGLFGCVVQVGNDPLYLDALLKGYPARFLNHSCDPNAYLYTVIAGMGAAQSKRVCVCIYDERNRSWRRAVHHVPQAVHHQPRSGRHEMHLRRAGVSPEDISALGRFRGGRGEGKGPLV